MDDKIAERVDALIVEAVSHTGSEAVYTRRPGAGARRTLTRTVGQKLRVDLTEAAVQQLQSAIDAEKAKPRPDLAKIKQLEQRKAAAEKKLVHRMVRLLKGGATGAGR